MSNISKNISCKSEDICAYLDEEMSADEIVCFENHIAACKNCADELQNQKSLLNELDFAFGSQEETLTLPKNFTKVIKTNAESDMSGLRQRKEKSRALRLCIALAVLSFVLLGWARFSDSSFVPIKNLLRVVGSFLGIVWRFIYDAGVGVVVIARAVSRHFVLESNPLNYLLLLIFLFSIFLLSRLVRRYYRA